MKKIELKEKSIIITTQKKKLFGGLSEKTLEINLEDIELVSKEMFGAVLNSSTIFLKNGQEEFIAAEDLESEIKLNEMLEWFINNKINYGYRMEMLNIETMEREEI